MQMGKAGRWLRSFLTGKKDKKGRDEGEADSHSFPSTGQVSALPTPSAKEKRRWSFRRPAAVSGKDTSTSGQGQLASTSSHCFSEVLAAVQDQHAVAVPDAAGTAGTASKGSAVGDAEEAAAVRIQSAFRSYLARKALCALRGMVKLQAIVRGQLVRRQANMTLRRIQALVAAQRRARAERLRLIDDGKTLARTPRPRTSRRSPQHHRASRKPLVSANDHGMLRAAGSEENVRIVEVDDGGGEARGARRSSCCSTPARAELYQKASPTPSGLTTDGSARTFSGRFEEHSASFSAASEASGRHHRSADPHAAAALLFPRNYMANTESSRAKARSQSAPRHRPASASGSEAVPSSPSCERPPSVGGGMRRRASIDPGDLDGARAGPSRNRGSDETRVERCASQARAGAGAGAGSACQSAVRLDGRPSVSLPGSECGSSSSAVVASAAAGARMA